MLCTTTTTTTTTTITSTTTLTTTTTTTTVITATTTTLTTTTTTLLSRHFSEKLTGPQLIKQFPAFYGTQRFITIFTTACHLSLSSAR
jgi:hypothetical protein